MKNINQVIFLLILIINLGNSFDLKAQNKSVTDTININMTDTVVFDCYDGTQIDMTICSMKEFEYYDSILTKKYDRLIMLLDRSLVVKSKYDEPFEYDETNNIKDAIVSSQEIWIKLRNRNSKILELQYKGGSMQYMMQNLQMTTDTKDRIKLIDELLNNEIE